MEGKTRRYDIRAPIISESGKEYLVERLQVSFCGVDIISSGIENLSQVCFTHTKRSHELCEPSVRQIHCNHVAVSERMHNIECAASKILYFVAKNGSSIAVHGFPRHSY